MWGGRPTAEERKRGYYRIAPPALVVLPINAESAYAREGVFWSVIALNYRVAMWRMRRRRLQATTEREEV